MITDVGQLNMLITHRILSADHTHDTFSWSHIWYCQLIRHGVLSVDNTWVYCQLIIYWILSADHTRGTVSSSNMGYCQLMTFGILSADDTRDTLSWSDMGYSQLIKQGILSAYQTYTSILTTTVTPGVSWPHKSRATARCWFHAHTLCGFQLYSSLNMSGHTGHTGRMAGITGAALAGGRGTRRTAVPPPRHRWRSSARTGRSGGQRSPENKRTDNRSKISRKKLN